MCARAREPNRSYFNSYSRLIISYKCAIYRYKPISYFHLATLKKRNSDEEVTIATGGFSSALRFTEKTKVGYTIIMDHFVIFSPGLHKQVDYDI